MNNLRLIVPICFLVLTFSSCKEENDPPTEFSLPGDWTIAEYNHRVERIGQTTQIETKTELGKFKFNEDGSGMLSLSQTVPMLTEGDLTWSRAGETLTLDMTSEPDLLQIATFTIEVISPTKMKMSIFTIGDMTDTYTNITLNKRY